MLRITVSFKQTLKDIKLFNEVNSKEEKSEFIKKCIEFYMNYMENNKNKA